MHLFNHGESLTEARLQIFFLDGEMLQVLPDFIRLSSVISKSNIFQVENRYMIMGITKTKP